MAEPSFRRSRFAAASEVALALLTVAMPILLGGAPSWVIWPLVGLSGTATALAAVAARREQRPLRLPLLGAALALAVALCFVQLLPLPAAFLNLTSPPAAALRAFALEPLGISGPRAITLDPAATWRELAKHLSYLGVFASAIHVSRQREARRRLLAVIALTGALESALGLGHRLVNLQSLFGGRLLSTEPPLVTTFGNPNHLAGFLILSSTLCLGFALSARTREPSWLWGLAYLVTGAGLLLSLSRGGIFFFVVGQLLLAGLLALRRRASTTDSAPPREWRSRLLLPIAALGSVLSIAAYVAYSEIATELSTADSLEKLNASKIHLWPDYARACWEFARLGMGRGAFEAAFTRFQTVEGITFSHPENAVFQLVAEFGLVPGLAVLVLAGFGFVRIARTLFQSAEEPSAVEFAALAGVFAVALHNLFDFNLELPAVACAATVALGIVARRDERTRSLPRRSGPAWAVAVALLALVAAVRGRTTLARDEEAVAAAARARQTGQQVLAMARAGIDRHPADYALYGLAAAAFAAQSPPDPRQALALINRSLYLKPLDWQAHLVAARALLQLQKRSQAFLEYRLAFESAPDGQSGIALDESVPRARTLAELQALVPAGVAPASSVLHRLWVLGRQAEAGTLVNATLESTPDVPEKAGLWVWQARILYANSRPLDATASLARAEKLDPNRSDVAKFRAAFLIAAGRQQEAVAGLQSVVDRRPEEVDLSFALAEDYLRVERPSAAKSVLERVAAFATKPGDRARLLQLQGQTQEAESMTASALQSYQAASRLNPDSAELHLLAAHALETLHRYADASTEVHSAMRVAPQIAMAQGEWLARLAAKERLGRDGVRERLLESLDAGSP